LPPRRDASFSFRFAERFQQISVWKQALLQLDREWPGVGSDRDLPANDFAASVVVIITVLPVQSVLGLYPYAPVHLVH
jgi:hypothetical protein